MSENEFFKILDEENRFPDTESRRILNEVSEGIQQFFGSFANCSLVNGLVVNGRMEYFIEITYPYEGKIILLNANIPAGGYPVELLFTFDGIRVGDANNEDELRDKLRGYLSRKSTKELLRETKAECERVFSLIHHQADLPF